MAEGLWGAEGLWSDLGERDQHTWERVESWMRKLGSIFFILRRGRLGKVWNTGFGSASPTSLPRCWEISMGLLLMLAAEVHVPGT